MYTRKRENRKNQPHTENKKAKEGRRYQRIIMSLMKIYNFVKETFGVY